ncbi:MAG: WHG domain-containing protein [Clostridiales bacterium]|nr:WHG domain-containing protein [Clostridiales bacterium]
MPPKAKYTKEAIIRAALDVVRAGGASALTARALGNALGSSVAPVFTVFKNMNEVQQEVLAEAKVVYQNYLQRSMAEGKYPVYKASGMGYICFARDESELFKLLFMRDRSAEKVNDDEEIKKLLEMIQQSTGLSENDARMFHTEMWLYVHGIAVTIATSYLEWNEDFINRVLSDGYMGLKARYESTQKQEF